MKAVCCEIICIQVLSVVIAADIINVRLIALVNVVAEEMRVAQLVDDVLHLHGHLVQVILILGICGRIFTRQQRMENNDRLV